VTVRVESTGGVSVAVHDLGGSGPPLLFSHATGFHAHCYLPLALALADEFACSGVDYRGHGDSTEPVGWDGEYLDWRGCGDDAIAAAETIVGGSGRTIVGVGHSMGGAALLIAAARRTELFDRLVLFEPIVPPPRAARSDPETFPMVIGARRRRRWFESFDTAYENYASKLPMSTFDPEVLRLYVDHGLRPMHNDEGGGVELCCSPEFEAATFAGAMTNGVWDLLADVRCPVLVVTGAVEPEQPSAYAAALTEHLRHGTHLELPHMTHFGPFTHIAEVASVVAT
jgi:pimeloyl-ACP methyl ester carboxylesterase